MEKTRNQIDYILVNQRFKNSVKNCKSRPGAYCGSDHNSVIIKIQIKLKKIKKTRSARKRWNVQELKKEDKRKEFAIESERKLEELRKSYKEANKNTNTKWKQIKECISEIAENSVGRITPEKKQVWMTKEILEKIKKEKTAEIKESRQRPVATNAVETWVPTNVDKDILSRWDRKMYGAIQDEGFCGVRTRKELYELYNQPDIVTEFSRARLRWLGHLNRMHEKRSPRLVWEGKPAGKRAVRRLKKDSAEEDLKLLGVKNWRQKTKDRPLWRKVAEEAKDLQGLR
ncbi:Craniofacial development protein 2 [Nymphon striatum]|nr:Craniofacial development protein 2 [Nymphon striatum]